jgi:signal peptidase I/TM2 domain-containing membrane protein YozV
MRDDDDTTPPRRPSRREPGHHPPLHPAPRRKRYVGRRTRRPSGQRKRPAPAALGGRADPKRPLAPEQVTDTDYGKRPGADAYEEGPSPLVASLLALAFSGLGQLYNGRLVRAVLSVALPAVLLVVAVSTGSATVYLMAVASGAFTAPTAVTLLAVAAGWLDVGHPALWMGLPIKLAMVAEAGLDAYQTRRRHQRRMLEHKNWVRIVYLACTGLLLLVWMLSTATATVRQPGMSPVLEPGDHLVVDRLAWGLQLPLIGVRLGGSPMRRGERVAVLDPDGSGRLLVRRVFAVAGDRVDFGPPGGPHGIRMPMLGRGGGAVAPVPWLPWRGPCVFALEVKRRRPDARYARCQAYQEVDNGRTFVVSYPLPGGPHRGGTYKTGTVGRGQVYLLADNRGAARDSRHWGPVPTRRIRGRPTVVLWSSDPLEGIRWHRMGLRIEDRP